MGVGIFGHCPQVPADHSPSSSHLTSTLQQLNLGSKAHDSFSLKIGYKSRVGDLRGQGVWGLSLKEFNPKPIKK